MSKRKTSLKLVREEDGSVLVSATFSDKDKERKNDNEVLKELLRDGSTPEFYDFYPSEINIG
jgi:hypothetical protein